MPWFALMSRAPWWEPDDSENALTLTDAPGILRLTEDAAATARATWAARTTTPTTPTSPTPTGGGLIGALIGAAL